MLFSTFMVVKAVTIKLSVVNPNANKSALITFRTAFTEGYSVCKLACPLNVKPINLSSIDALPFTIPLFKTALVLILLMTFLLNLNDCIAAKIVILLRLISKPLLPFTAILPFNKPNIESRPIHLPVSNCFAFKTMS